MSAAAAPPRQAGMDAGQARAEYDDKVRFFNSFLHGNRDEWEKKINSELANGKYRVRLEMRELDRAEAGLARKVLEEPVKYLVPWEEALLNFLRDINEKAERSLTQPLKLDIEGAFGRHHVTPRGMTANTLNNMMCVEGVVIKAGLASPKLLQSIHVRKEGDDAHVESRDHRDATAFVNSLAAGAMPSHDLEGNRLEVEIGLSVYKDSQKFCIQESPENAPPGHIPRSIEVICEGDLADKAKAGDRVQVVGVYKSFPPRPHDFTTGVYPARLIATNITPLKEMTNQPFVSDDVTNIHTIGNRSDAFQLLARSFAPSICGHENPKKGMLLQMIGGTEKNLANGTHLRGDINLLLVGDPSCGKSQMLRFVMNTAPLAVSTTGKGSSGVGLTAALTREPGSRDFTIEAGAMVLADRGFICIDEFDKMGESDRVMIHEAMEQQCVTIAKAGLHVTLNARCSVVAAANPIYGNFDSNLDLAKNINMPDSLLSRFDLVFVVRDLTTEEIDRRIAEQVVRQASQRLGSDARRGVEQVHSNILQRRQEEDRKTQEAAEVFERSIPGPNGEQPPEVLTVDFLRKYIRFCRRFTPVLTEEAQTMVAEKYCDMRMRFQTGMADNGNPEATKKPRLAVTTRTLEGIIRLSTAHAKLKLRKYEVLPEDVQEAYKLMMAAREEDVPTPATVNVDGGDDAPDQDGGDDTKGSGGKRGKKRTRQQAAAGTQEGEEAISGTRVTALTTLVARFFARQQTQQLSRAELLQGVNAGLVQGEEAYGDEEFNAGLAVMEARNKVFVVEDSGEVMLVG
jgi:DNA replication licensing factor MCM3